jgi:hypothetical protein
LWIRISFYADQDPDSGSALTKNAGSGIRIETNADPQQWLQVWYKLPEYILKRATVLVQAAQKTFTSA